MKNRIPKYAINALLCSVVLTNAYYAGETGDESEQGFNMSLSSIYQYDDNVTRSSNNQIDAYVFILRPELGWGWNTGTSNYGISISNETGKYEGSSEDNYSSSSLNFNAGISINTSNRLSLEAGYADTYQARGQGFSIGTGSTRDSVDTLSQSNIGARYTYGREAADAELSIYYTVQNVDFDSILDSFGDDITADRDRANNVVGLAFEYELGARTNLVFDYNQSEQDYDIETGLDYTVDSALVGISWAATAKTSGRVMLGNQKRDLNTGESSDSSIWQVSLNWSPKTYSRVSVESRRSSEASIGIGNARDIESTTISWSHDWSSKWITNFSLNDEKTLFSGTNTSLDAQNYIANLSYLFDNNINFSLSYQDSSRESNSDDALVFDQTIYGLQIIIEIL